MKKKGLYSTITIKKAMRKKNIAWFMLVGLLAISLLSGSALALSFGAGTFTNPQASQFINGTTFVLKVSNATLQTPDSNVTNVTFSYTRTSPSGGTITQIGVNRTTNLVNQPDIRFVWDTTGVVDGLYTLTAQYRNVTDQSENTTITNVAVDNTNPSIRMEADRLTLATGKQEVTAACASSDPSDSTITFELILRDQDDKVVRRQSAERYTFPPQDFVDDGEYDLACITNTNNPRWSVINQTLIARKPTTAQLAIKEGIISGDSRFQTLIGSPNAKVFLLLGGGVFFVLLSVLIYSIFFHKKKRR